MSHSPASRASGRSAQHPIIRTVDPHGCDRSPNAGRAVALQARRAICGVGVILAIMGLGGCAADTNRQADATPTTPIGQSGVGQPGVGQPAKVTMVVDGPDATAAIASGQRVNWGPLRDRLSEAAGGVVLEELALDAAIEAELSRQGVTVTDAMVKDEDRLLRRAIILDARMTADQAERAVVDLRRREGLGPKRYADLLRRNAKLRALARQSMALRLNVSDEEARTAAELMTGPRARARIIVVDSDRAAANVREQIMARIAGGEQPSTAFANAAIVFSRDQTATRGGLLEGISAADAVVPDGVRRALRQIKENTVSDVLPLDTGAALLLVESRTPGSEPNRADIDAARNRVELRKERAAMDEIATRLLNESRVTIYDESLRWSWESRRE